MLPIMAIITAVTASLSQNLPLMLYPPPRLPRRKKRRRGEKTRITNSLPRVRRPPAKWHREGPTSVSERAGGGGVRKEDRGEETEVG